MLPPTPADETPALRVRPPALEVVELPVSNFILPEDSVAMPVLTAIEPLVPPTDVSINTEPLFPKLLFPVCNFTEPP